MKVYIKDSPEEVIEKIARDITALANEKVNANGRFTMALSGGSSPRKLYEALVAGDSFPWEKTWFFFGDERYVPSDHPEYNGKMAREAMLDHVPVPSSQVFFVNTSLSPAEAARQYASVIRDNFEDPVFDLILLGLGDDAHTASLFPHTRVLAETDVLVKEVQMLHDNSWRITMTRPLLNKAAAIFFLTFGAKKAEAVYHVLEGERYEFQYPSQLIAPENGEISWYIDREAASRLRSRQYQSE